MNRENIIRMAKEAAAQYGHTIKATDEIVETLTSFALIVECETSKKAHERGYQLGLEIGAAVERKECLRICDEEVRKQESLASVIVCAALIKGRDKK